MEMEAPLSAKPPQKDDENLNVSKYTYSVNNEDYLISLYIDNTTNQLIIKSVPINSINDKVYSFKSTLDDLKSINKFFTLFDSIYEIKEEIESYFSNNNQISLIKLNDNEMKIQLKVNIKKIENIEFILSGQKMPKDILINQLIYKVNSLENENKILKNQINELYSIFAEEISQKKIMKNNIIGQNETIKKFENYDLIRKGILSTYKSEKTEIDKKENENENVKLNLIYKATRDGGSADIFHKLCDGKGPIVCVFNTDKGMTFGGYTEKKWQNYGGDKADKNSFLFSFNFNKIYRNNCEDDAIKFESSKGPYFCYAINTQENFFEKETNCVRSKSDSKNSWQNIEKDFELTNGNEYFNLRDLEVYEVNID